MLCARCGEPKKTNRGALCGSCAQRPNGMRRATYILHRWYGVKSRNKTRKAKNGMNRLFDQFFKAERG